MDSENNVTSPNTSVEQDENDNQNQCGICLTDYKSPRILPCKHIFCRLCLTKLLDQKQDAGVEAGLGACPMCREEIKLSSNEVDKLPMYFDDDDDDGAINDVAEDVDESLINLCVVCKNNVPAEFECFQCQKLLCATCKQIHDELLKHDVQDLKLDLSQDKCVKHPEIKVRYICLDCGSIHCKECVKLEHGLHQTLTLKSYMIEIDGELTNYSSEIVQKIETVEMSKAKFSSNTESQVLENIQNVRILGEDFKIELEKACGLENKNQLADKTLLNRINFMGRRIRKSKKKRKFNQILISDIKELKAKLTTHKRFYLPNKMDDIINNQIGKMDVQIGRLFVFQLDRDGKGEFNIFFGNINWSITVSVSSPVAFSISLIPFIKPKDTLLIESITTTITLYVEKPSEIFTTLRKFTKTFKSANDELKWEANYMIDNSDQNSQVVEKNYNRDGEKIQRRSNKSNVFSFGSSFPVSELSTPFPGLLIPVATGPTSRVKVLFQRTSIKHRTLVE